MGNYPEFDKRVIGWVNSLRAQAKTGLHSPEEFVSLDHLLHDMRLYKSRPEQSLMRQAASISVRAHERAMRVCRPGMNEAELEAEFLHEFRRHGGTPAYNPIVGGVPTAASCTTWKQPAARGRRSGAHRCRL